MSGRAAKLLIKGGKAELFGSKHLHNTALDKAVSRLGYSAMTVFVIAAIGGSFTAGVEIHQNKAIQSLNAQAAQNTEILLKAGALIKSDPEFKSEPTDEDRPSFR